MFRASPRLALSVSTRRAPSATRAPAGVSSPQTAREGPRGSPPSFLPTPPRASHPLRGPPQRARVRAPRRGGGAGAGLGRAARRARQAPTLPAQTGEGRDLAPGSPFITSGGGCVASPGRVTVRRRETGGRRRLSDSRDLLRRAGAPTVWRLFPSSPASSPASSPGSRPRPPRRGRPGPVGAGGLPRTGRGAQLPASALRARRRTLCIGASGF